ncbi:MAG: restriction endonuclease subunit S [Promethearchaeota archaeon]|nr:MAG: restriction endonuclease subunit S [Candidatus Lokiarchaeota archaeon]
MNEWQEVTLQDVVTILGDGLHGTPKYVDDGEYYFINGNNLRNGKIIVNELTRKASVEEYNKFKKDLNERTILVSINGTLGNIALYNNEKCILGKSACYFNVRSDVDKLFIKYVVTNRRFQKYIDVYAHGTTIKNVSLKTMREYPFSLPLLPEQRAIAGVLYSLDDKIDLLHRQNETLEALAQSLFRQWFVEEAQDDWEIGSLYEAIALVGGGTPKTSEESYWGSEINWLSGSDISANHKSFINVSTKKITQEGLDHSSTKLLPRFSTVITARGTVGKYCILAEPMAFSQTNYGIIPKFENSFFFTYLLIDHSVSELMSAAYGSVFDTITTRTFQEFQINIPSVHEILVFEEQVNPYFQKMKVNQEQILTLEKIRDTLLPELISGRVRIKEGKEAD